MTEFYPSFLIYGLSRRGKTYQAKILADAGFKVLVISAEMDGLESIKPELDSGAISFHILASHEDAAMTIQNLLESCPYDVVFFDSLTSIYMMELDDLKIAKNATRPWAARIDRNDRGTATDLLENVFRWGKRIPAVIVFTASEEASVKRAEGEVEEWDSGPALPGKARYRWPPLVTEFYRAVYWKDDKGEEHWALATQEIDGHPAGTRYRRFGIEKIEPDLSVIFRKIGISVSTAATSAV